LHASRLRLIHPATGAALQIEAPMPDDMVSVLRELREYRSP